MISKLALYHVPQALRITHYEGVARSNPAMKILVATPTWAETLLQHGNLGVFATMVSDESHEQLLAEDGIYRQTYDIQTQIDADLQFPACGLPQILKPLLEDKADIVLGTRYLKDSHINKKH